MGWVCVCVTYRALLFNGEIKEHAFQIRDVPRHEYSNSLRSELLPISSAYGIKSLESLPSVKALNS